MSELGTPEKAAGAGAVLAAALASMCCILPLGLGAIGLSGAVVSAFFEPLRSYLLVLAGGLLAAGFYFSFRGPAEGEACSTGASKLSRASRPTLFVAALATVVLAMFPSIVGFASDTSEALAPAVKSNVVVLRVEGMTCEACATGVRHHLLDVPGVIDAAVSYEDKLAEVRVRQERSPETSLLVEAVKKAGYTAYVSGR